MHFQQWKQRHFEQIYPHPVYRLILYATCQTMNFHMGEAQRNLQS